MKHESDFFLTENMTHAAACRASALLAYGRRLRWPPGVTQPDNGSATMGRGHF